MFNLMFNLVNSNKTTAAKLMRMKSEFSMSEESGLALRFYLVRYLQFLHQGGNDVLYDVPHIDGIRIDYQSLGQATGKTEVAGKTQMGGKTEVGKTQMVGKTEVAGKTEMVGKTESYTGLAVHSVEVAKINAYLLKLWKHAVSLSQTSDHLAAALAEISSVWVYNRVIEKHFFARFGAPEIRATCPHEVILLFNVDEIAWFDNTQFAMYVLYTRAYEYELTRLQWQVGQVPKLDSRVHSRRGRGERWLSDQYQAEIREYVSFSDILS